MIKTYSPILQMNVDALIGRINRGFASCIVVFGGLGQGKTTLGIHIADHVNKYYGHGPVDLDTKEQIATGGEEFKQKIIKCYRKGLHVVIYDESGDFSGRSYYSRLNRELYRVFQVYRAFRILVVLILPSFTDMDTGLFKLDVVRLGLHLRKRNEERGVFYGYSLKKLIYAKHNISKGRVVPAFSLKSVSANFCGIFKNLEKERAEKLDRLSTAAKVMISKGIIEKKKEVFDRRFAIDESLYRW